MEVLAWLLVTAVGFYLLHRLALWAESRGYIYYRDKGPSRSSLGNAFLETQGLIEPDKRVLVEAIREERPEHAELGAPPQPGEFDPRDASESQQ